MNQQISQAAVSNVIDIDALVARYAPIGRQLRRRRKLNRLLATLLLVVLGIAVIFTFQYRGAILDKVAIGSDTRIRRAMSEVRGLRASLKAEAGAMAAQRAELARQQEVFRQRNDALAGQLAAINEQRATLANQRQQFDVQKQELANAIAKADGQRRNLQASTEAQSSIDRQLREIERQKKVLEQQQRQFHEQGEVLSRKLADINRQRAEIEQQRQSIQEQQAEVRRLLEQVAPVGANRQPEPQQPETRQSESASGSGQPGEQAIAGDTDPARLVGGEIATMAAVEPAVLGNMRGGIDLGADYSFAIGITRTTSINGIEQLSSAMYINELAQATGAGTSTQTIQLGEPVIIQNGPGNFVDAGALANMGLSSPTIIQNSLDNQTISNQTVLDISLHNVSSLIQGMDLSRISRDGMTLPR